LRVERIVSLGQASAPGFWYDQAEGEWVLVLAGAASTFSPTSMSLSSASTVAALGMPLSDPARHRRRPPPLSYKMLISPEAKA
jgi:hypothetical protein